MIAVVITGNIGSDPEMRYAGQTPVLEFRVASNDRQKVGQEYKDVPTWVRVSLFGKRAEQLQPHLAKGSSVVVRGTIQEREFVSKGETRKALECKADDVNFLGPRRRDGDEGPAGRNDRRPESAGDGRDDFPDAF